MTWNEGAGFDFERLAPETPEMPEIINAIAPRDCQEGQLKRIQ